MKPMSLVITGTGQGRQISCTQVLLTYPQCKETKEALMEFIQGIPNIMCAVVAHEEHHETEGEHLHAWIKFKTTVKITVSRWAHFFDFNGYHGNYQVVKVHTKSVADTVKYVIKDGDYIVWNCDVDAIINPLCKRKKYNTERILSTDIRELVKNGEIRAQDFVRIRQAQQIWKIITAPHADADHTRGIWMYGPAGCGKSQSARAFGEKYGGAFIKPQNKWWDGYEGQKVVILDDLDTDALNHYLKIWTDKYACTGEVKGSTVPLVFDWFIVTSNYKIDDIIRLKNLALDTNLSEALHRRFREMDYYNYENEQHKFFTVEDIEEAAGLITAIQPLSPELLEPIPIPDFFGYNIE